MAIGTSTQQPTPPPLSSRVTNTGEYQQYIERKLTQTRRQLKRIDLGAALFQWAALVLGAILICAVLDHWVIEFSTGMRVFGLLALVSYTVFHFGWTITPLVWKSINPVFAAKAIEQTTPSLKNSLINFLLLRPQRGASQEGVIQALEQRAATDLSQIDLEQTIDRGRLIRFAAIFTGVFFAAAMYQIASPKNALATAARVLAPWSAIERPSRVTIRDVQPGSTEVYFGNTVDVSAHIVGLGRSESPRLVYSTADGRLTNESLELTYSDSSHRFELKFPPDKQGLRQNVAYRIVAGDSTSPEFRITVLPTPTIHVERVEYRFPAYAKRPEQRVDHNGDIRALAGTRVTLHASTNQPIRSARLEFDPQVASESTAAASSPPRLAPIPMQSNGQEASISFLLESSADGKSGKFSSYQLSFVNTSGVPSNNSIVHRIDVDPDLPPEIEILAPRKEQVEVAENGHLMVELRAIDPDFGLSQIDLHLAKDGKDVFEKNLLSELEGRSGQVIAKYDLIPGEVGLHSGDTALLWATATDNRASVGSEKANPNAARTRNIRVSVTEPVRSGADDKSNKSPEKKPDTKPDTKEEKNQDGADKNTPSKSESKKSTNRTKTDNRPSGEKEKKKGPQSGSTSAEPMESTGESNEKQQGGAQGNGAGGGGGQQDNQASGWPGQQKDGTGQSASQTGNSQKGSQGSGQAAKPGASTEEQNQEESNEPLHDGEVIEKVLRRIQGADDSSKGSGATAQSKPSTESAQPSNSDADGSGRQGQNSNSKNSSKDREKPGVGDDRKADPKANATPEGSPKRHSDKNQGAGQRKDGNPGEGGKTANGGMEKDRGPKPEPKDKDRTEKDPGTGTNGDSGDGQNSKDKSGGSAPKKVAPDRDKRLNPESQKPDDRDPPGAADSEKDPKPKQSDSKGGSSGEHSGGGKKGSKQGANQPGNDSAGQSSSSDDGAGKSNESGAGEVGPNAGDRQTTNDKTGNPGDKQGPGSGARQSPNGAPMSDGPQDQQAKPEKNETSQPKQQGSKTGGARGTREDVLRGGVPGDGESPPSNRPERVIPDGEKANLEYARKATDMVVEYLKDQKNAPDSRLLDELKWTTEDLDRFLRRWDELRKTARDEKSAGGDFEDALRSLGLRPPKDKSRQGPKVNDDRHGLRESGARTLPPAKYREQFKEFQKSGR